MNKMLIIFVSTIIVLLLLLSIIYPQMRVAKEQNEEATQLATSAKRFLSANEIRCTARASDFLGVKSCIDEQLRKNDFSISAFNKFDERRNENGTFVIQNEGSRTYNGSQFVLEKNGIVVKEGCHITSSILPEYTCRFDIIEPCTVGDVFAVSYINGENPLRVVTRSC